MEKPPNFITIVDNLGLPYFAANLLTIKNSKLRPVNASEVGNNICTFLSETLVLSRQATGIFFNDLTSRDDLILAVLSLLLILVIEGILTTILLRTHDGKVSNIGFSIKQFVDLAREFKFRYLIWGRRSSRPRKRNKINIRLLAIATVILAFTFGLEVLVLFLSSPQLTDVTNETTAFTLRAVVNPDWNEVRTSTRAASNRPCTAVTFATDDDDGLEQGRSQISACLSSNLSTSSRSDIKFEKAESVVNMTFVSQLHEFGAEHFITIGNLTASYTARAYFALDDQKDRLMRKRGRFFVKEEEYVAFLHKQFIAYLFTVYSRETKDTSMNLERLQKLNFKFKVENGENVDIVQINLRERFRHVTSTKYMTTVTGIIPNGMAALRFGQITLKGGSAITLGPPSRYDLVMGSGDTFGKKALMWRETSRTLNWLSLGSLLIATLLVFALLRFILKPAGTAEIAGAWVSAALAATREDDRRKTFSVSMQSRRAVVQKDKNEESPEQNTSEEYAEVLSTASATI